MDIYESISLAFLLLLGQLQPIERAVFLLREVLDYDYVEIAHFLDKSEESCRQSFSRAKKHHADHRPRFAVPPDAHRQLLTSFLQAVQGDDMTSLTNLLAEDVTLWADGDGKTKGAATRPLIGREAGARFSIGTNTRFSPAGSTVELAEVNGQLALVARTADRAYFVLTIEAEAKQITAIRIVGNPDKLCHM